MAKMTLAEMLEDYENGDLQWVSANGKTTYVQDLVTTHLINIINKFKSNPSYVENGGSWVQILNRELVMRNTLDIFDEHPSDELKTCYKDSSALKSAIINRNIGEANTIAISKYQEYHDAASSLKDIYDRLKVTPGDQLKQLKKIEDLHAKVVPMRDAWHDTVKSLKKVIDGKD